MNTLNDIERLQFKLEGVDSYRVMGIDIGKKKGVSDFTAMDGIKLMKSYKDKKFPVEFILNVGVKNPNDKNKKVANKNLNMRLAKLEWRLLIDDRPTISGVMNTPVRVPSRGETVVVPLSIGLDLYEFFAKKGYDGMLNMALAVGGMNSRTSSLKLDVRPSVTTSFGQIQYPGRITVVDKEWRD